MFNRATIPLLVVRRTQPTSHLSVSQFFNDAFQQIESGSHTSDASYTSLKQSLTREFVAESVRHPMTVGRYGVVSTRLCDFFERGRTIRAHLESSQAGNARCCHKVLQRASLPICSRVESIGARNSIAYGRGVGVGILDSNLVGAVAVAVQPDRYGSVSLGWV